MFCHHHHYIPRWIPHIFDPVWKNFTSRNFPKSCKILKINFVCWKKNIILISQMLLNNHLKYSKFELICANMKSMPFLTRNGSIHQASFLAVCRCSGLSLPPQLQEPEVGKYCWHLSVYKKEFPDIKHSPYRSRENLGVKISSHNSKWLQGSELGEWS